MILRILGAMCAGVAGAQLLLGKPFGEVFLFIAAALMFAALDIMTSD